MLLFLYSCTSNREYKVEEIKFEDNVVYTCDEYKVKDEKVVPLSQFIDSFEIIRLEDNKDAFFKFGWIAISSNYFAIRQSGGPVKLFKWTGEFVNNVGNIGRGPGEYRAVSDILIDERNDVIYVAPISGSEILQYNLKGDFIKEIRFPEGLNKPKLFLNPDGTVSVVHLCFVDKGNTFTTATFNPASSDSLRFLFSKDLALRIKNNEGKGVGFNNEIWSYRNSRDFPFAFTTRDTLYNFNVDKNQIEAKLTLSMLKERKGKSYFVFNELPDWFQINIVGGEYRKSILIDKDTKQVLSMNLVNDFLGNIPVSFRFQDGYWFDVIDPLSFKEKLDEHLISGDCPSSQIEKLTELMNSLEENDNSILLIGSIKGK